MRKVILVFLSAFILASCNKQTTTPNIEEKQNSIIGSWYSSKSYKSSPSMDMGTVCFFDVNDDSTLVFKYIIQASADGKEDDFNQEYILYGKWEMPSKEKMIIHMERAVVNGEETPNKHDVEYTIIKVDEKDLEMMSGGKMEKYQRK